MNGELDFNRAFSKERLSQNVPTSALDEVIAVLS